MEICIISPLIFLFLFCAMPPPPISAFCPPGCECHDDQLEAKCNFTGLTAIPILLNPMLKRLAITNSNALKLDTFSIALYQELESLDLSHSHISQIPSGFFGRLPKLRVLNLRGNDIKLVDNGTFQGVKTLEYLDLSSNQLHTLDPTAFSTLANLSTLLLTRNRISKIVKFDRNNNILTQLEHLDLSGNLISELMTCPFSSLNKLRKLDLSSNLISCMDTKAFSGLTALEELNLARNLLSTPSMILEGCISRPNWVDLMSLKKLDLSGNAWTEIPPNVFEGGLWELTELRLEEMSQLREIKPRAFVGLPKLRRLSLAKSTFLAQISPQAFEHGFSGLEQLDLSNCQLTTLLSDLFDWTNLKKLKLDGNRWNCDCELMEFLPKFLEAKSMTYMTEVQCAKPDEFRDQNILAVSRNFSFSDCASSPSSPLQIELFSRPFLYLASVGLVLFLTSLFCLISFCFCGPKKRASFCGRFSGRKRMSGHGSAEPKQLYVPGSSSYTESLIAYETAHQSTKRNNGQNLKQTSNPGSSRQSNTLSSSNDADAEYYSSIGPGLAQQHEERRDPPASPPPPPPPYFAPSQNWHLAPTNLYGAMPSSCPVAIPPYQLRGTAGGRRNEQRPPSIVAPPPPTRRTIVMPNY